ncbi:MAG TPA: hypothetical protein DFS52_21765 [Myxococcales bacterium]|nr:hypothetical protein [Myxococcales bacterium]
MNPLSAFAAVSLLAAASAPAASTCSPTPTDFSSLLAASQEDGKAGDWVEYARLIDGKPDYTATFRIVVLEAEKGGAPWIEFWLDKTGRTALRARGGGPVAIDAYLKTGAAIFSMDLKGAPETRRCSGAGPGPGPDLRQVSLKTLAGTLQCKHIAIRSEEGLFQVWQSEQVPAMRLARVQSPKGDGFEVVAMGGNGKSVFPARFEAAPLPLQNMKSFEGLLPRMPEPKAASAATADPVPPTPASPAPAARPATPQP